jgi:PAS domain S-box-containing protein
MPERHSTKSLLSQITAIARSLASAHEMREVMQRVASAAVDLTRARGAYVEQVVSPGGTVEVVAVAGTGAALLGLRVPYPGSLTEEIIEGALPVLLTELGTIGAGIAPYLAHHCGECSALVAPLLSADGVLGALVLVRSVEEEPFDEEETALVQTLGDLASISLRRVRLLQDARSEREQRTALLNSTGEGIYGVDTEQRCTFLNRAGARMLGYSPEEVLGENMHDLIHHTRPDGSRYPEDECPIFHAVRSGEGVRVEDDVLWRRDGTSFPAEYGSSPIREQGRIVGAVVTFMDISERRAAAEILLESEQRFRGLAENAAEAIVTLDVDDAIVYANPAVEEIFGYSAEELRRLRLTDLMPERYRHRHREGIERHVATGRRRVPWDGMELPGLHKDGREIPLEITFGEFVRDGRHYFTGIMRDITERKSAEAERERLLERESFLAEASAILASSLHYQVTLRRVTRLAVPRIADYCVIDVLEADGRLHRVAAAHADPGMAEIIRARSADAPAPGSRSPALRVLETGEPELATEITDEWIEAVAQSPEHRELMRRLAPRSAIIVPLRARGRTFGILWFLFSTSGRRFGPGDLTLARELALRAGVAVDNARLYEAAEEARGEAERRAREEAALREATGAVSASGSTEEVIRRIAGSAVEATNADGAFVVRIDIGAGEVVVVAAAGAVSPEVGTRAPYAGSFAEQVVEHAEAEIILRLADAGDRLPPELVRACPEGSALVVPLADGGEPIGALLMIRGEEKRRFRPDEVKRARTFADLASLAFRKIHMLEDSERRREELQRVMESRARLMRGFSHDVKNPLGAADGFLSLMEEGISGELTETQKEHVTRARRAIGNSLSLIEDLLELARAEAGQIEIEWVPVDVRDAVRELAEEYRAQAETRGLALEVELPEALPVIESDATRVRQILGNLFSNAVKYTDEGEVRAFVELRSGDGAHGKAGEWIAAAVVDTGPGIPAEKHRLLFQEFTRLDPGEKKGAGVGLAISQRIAHALGGEITAESEAGAGSTFTLWLPCTRGVTGAEHGG